jgi:hypothetical protein
VSPSGHPGAEHRGALPEGRARNATSGARRLAASIVIGASALAATAAQAGRPCEEKPATTDEVTRGMALAQRVQQRLDATGAEVVILARAGQDLGRWGLQWSHLGFAYRDRGAGDGKHLWRVAHKLNHCGTAHGALYRQGLGEFFLDRPHRYEAAFVVLGRDAQAKLLPLLENNFRLAALNTPSYNMVAYPWATRYQQSNQWALETLASVLEPAASSRVQAQRWLQLKGYQPTTLNVGAFERLGARVGTAHIAFDDHPGSKRFSDRIETVTVDSVFAWLAGVGLGDKPQIVR